MISGISHANIRIRDIDRCLPFYVDVIGLTVSLDDGSQDLWRTLRRRAVFLRWDSGPQQSFIVLQSFPSADGVTDAEPADHLTILSAMGLNHFGLWVDDLDPILARASAAGVQVVRAPIDCVERHYGYDGQSDVACVRTVQLIDPENNVIQLDQWLQPGTTHNGDRR